MFSLTSAPKWILRAHNNDLLFHFPVHPLSILYFNSHKTQKIKPQISSSLSFFPDILNSSIRESTVHFGLYASVTHAFISNFWLAVHYYQNIILCVNFILSLKTCSHDPTYSLGFNVYFRKTLSSSVS